MLPSPPEEISTKFFLYPSHRQRRSGSSAKEVSFQNLTEAFTWAEKGFNSSLPTKIMIHGFGSDCTHVWVYEMRSALMAVVIILKYFFLFKENLRKEKCKKKVFERVIN